MRTLLAWDEERNAMIELREGRSPFGIKGQGDHRAISIGPLPSFNW
jgi:hypothetical protein